MGSSSRYVNIVPVYGLPGYGFHLIHATGLFSCCISIILSIGILVYLLREKRVYLRPIGERLVIYLAVVNLLWSLSHTFDHSYMYAVFDHPPNAACSIFGFLLNHFVISQALITTFTALNAFVMVVKEKKIQLGRYDWKLLVIAFGGPAIPGIVLMSTQYFGPSGAWCYIDNRLSLGPILNTTISIVMMLTFIFNLVFYGAVWVKIKQVANAVSGNSAGKAKYHRTAKVMMFFVAVYIMQWWPYIISSIWRIVAEPHLIAMWMVTLFSNLGGLFNFICYMLVKKKSQNAAHTGAHTQQASSGPKRGKVHPTRQPTQNTGIGTTNTIA